MALMVNDVKVKNGFLLDQRAALKIKNVMLIGSVEAMEKEMNNDIKQCYKFHVHYHVHHAHHAKTCRCHI